MKKFERTVSVSVVAFEDLSDSYQELMRQAIFVRGQSQCPHSGFAVGAAVLTDNGDISVGQNVENVTYTQTTHAEQSAITALITANGPGVKIDTIAIVAAPRSTRVEPLTVWGDSPRSMDDIFGPCGQCRQIIWENAEGDKDISVLILQPSGEVAVTTMGDLFPMPFGPNNI